MELTLSGPSNLVIAPATWDTDLKSNSDNINDKPYCLTTVNKVKCLNVQ